MSTNKENFILIGAGLPRTGTMSTREALKELIGPCYHMQTVFYERPDHHPFWRKALQGKASNSDWHTAMADFKCGVDYPISFFYKELMAAYPNAKVLLTVRDPVKWYESVKSSIYRLQRTVTSFPSTWVLYLVGRGGYFDFIGEMVDAVPTNSSLKLGIFSSVERGEEAAVKFYLEHVEEVRRLVPKDKLLEFEVKQGWEPLCKFLNVPVPNKPFPRINDAESMNTSRKLMTAASWNLIIGFPAALLGSLCWFGLENPLPSLALIGSWFFVIITTRILLAYGESAQKTKKE